MSASPREKASKAREKSVSVSQPSPEAGKKGEDYEDGRITVSVRVRPLNSRETKSATGSCVAALSAYNTLYIFPSGETHEHFPELLAQNPQLRGVAHHRFTFDHVYPTDATQEQVYEQIGHPVLQSSFRGYHTCIFAYGQTGSGKSYCMMGADGGRAIDDSPGIIPRLCREMFAEMAAREAAAADTNEEVEFSVYVSYLEIYRERVRSLLDEATDAKGPGATATPALKEPATPRSTLNALRRTSAALHSTDGTDGNLRVREHPTLGVYVEGLAEIPVTSVEQVLRLMVRGNHRRHTASTKMNDTSSRSHAIFTIQLMQKRVHNLPPPSPSGTAENSPTKTEAVKQATVAALDSDLAEATTSATTQLGAKINLVDLAGSERAKATGAEGDTLKEGAQINKSLTTLGIVINALAAQSASSAGASPNSRFSSSSSSAASKRHIPYRDSTLTFLLKESLGGNSKTFMIATVSPSTDNYDESLSTLRYADRAKAIVMRAFVNETAGDKRIRELEEEVTRLREKIKALLDAEATRTTSSAASPSLVLLSTAGSSSQTPVVLADSESVPPANESKRDARDDAAESAHSGETDLGGVERKDDDADDAEGEIRNADTERWDGSKALFPSSPSAEQEKEGEEEEPRAEQPMSPTEPQEVLVDTLQSELRRAEEMIRQMSATQAERDAHIARLMAEQEKERAATRAAAEAANAAREEAEKAAAAAAAASTPVATTASGTVRLHRDEPYLLNMDGAGDWVLAHLGPVLTYVGVFPHRRAKRKSATRRSVAEAAAAAAESFTGSYDSSLSLPSTPDNHPTPHEALSEEEEESDAAEGSVSSDAADIRYVRLPHEFGDGVGGPHCILERSPGSPTGTSSTVMLRGCDGWDTYVIRSTSGTPFVVNGGTDALALQSGDVLDLGKEHIQLKYIDPSAPPMTARGRRTAAMAVGNVFPGLGGGGVTAQEVGSTDGGRALRALSASPSSQAESPGASIRQRHAVSSSPSKNAFMTSAGALPHHQHEDEADTEDERATSRQTGDADENMASSWEHREDSTLSTPTEEPEGNASLPARPRIPTLALGKALPTSSASPSIPFGFAGAAHHTDPVAAAATGAPHNAAHYAPTATTTTSTNAGEEDEDEEGDRASSMPSSDWASSNTSNYPSTGLPPGSGKVLNFTEDLKPASESLVPFKSRKPSKRAEAASGAYAEPHAVMTPSELQCMRDSAVSGTYRSELPARFIGRYNLVLVGPSGGGKSSLVNNLAKPDAPWFQSAFSAFKSSARGSSSRDSADAAAQPTIGVRFKTLAAPGSVPVSLYTHELGGTPCFSPLLDQLPSHRVVYLLCFPLHGLTSLMTLRGVVEDILCRTDSHTVSLVLVGTHADRGDDGREGGSYVSRLPTARQEALQRQLEEVEQQVVSLIQMLQPYPQLRPTVVGRFAVDNVHRHIYTSGYHAVDGFPQWLQWLADVARDRCRADADFANGLVPARCLELGRQVSLLRAHGKWCVSLRNFKTLAAVVSSQYKSDAVDAARTVSSSSPLLAAAAPRDSLRNHVQLLADWGVLMHRYRSIQLRQHVILDVVWLSRLLAALACCPLIAAAESDGLSYEEAATMVDIVGEEGTMSLTRKEAALRTLLTPEAEQVVDMVKVATTDTPHLLRCGVLSMPVLIAMLERHFKTSYDDAGVPVGRVMDNSGHASSSSSVLSLEGGGPRGVASSASARGSNSGAVTKYAVPFAGVVELLVLLDLIIVGRKLRMSPTAPAATGAAATSRSERDGHAVNATAAAPPAAGVNGNGEDSNDDDDAFNVEKESFVLYPLSFRTPASAGVTWLFPCFLSGPFYVFKLDMVPRNFFPKLLCRLGTVADQIYLGPVKEKLWGSATQRWTNDPTRGRASTSTTKRTVVYSSGNDKAVVASPTGGPFDTYFEQRGTAPFVLPTFEPYLTTSTADGRPRRRDGFWFDAAWLIYSGSGDDARVGKDGCRVLIRLVHHSVFLSFHCHGVASSPAPAAAGMRDSRASAGVQDFYEAVLEAVRYVVEEFPGGKCVESIQCCVDSATLLQAELQHPATQSDQEAAVLDRHLRFANVSDNINNLERVLAKSGTALRTARTARRPLHHPGEQALRGSGKADLRDDDDDENSFVPLLRNFCDIPALSIHDCIRRWKSEQRLYIAPDVEAQLTHALHELEECYHGEKTSSREAQDSCTKLDSLLDVLARVDTA